MLHEYTIGLSSDPRSMSRGRALALGLVGCLLATLSTFVVSSPAQAAVSADCTAWKETKSEMGMDPHRARAYCRSIGSTTKVRARLIRDGAVDYHSSWFTQTYTTYSSGWATCYAGCRADYQLANR
jgi:hypothetical protein